MFILPDLEIFLGMPHVGPMDGPGGYDVAMTSPPREPLMAP
jgi:hypothetical protein